MRVFLSEHCTSGADRAAAAGPLAAEGAAMLRALAADAVEVEGVKVVVAWAAGLGELGVAGVEAADLAAAGGDPRFRWRRRFLATTAACDGSLHIAPECDGELARVTALVEGEDRLTARRPGWLGCSAESAGTCGDKRTLSRLPGVRQPEATAGGGNPGFPFVRKDALGAGGDGLLVRDCRDWQTLPTEARMGNAWLDETVVHQRLVPGRPCSVAVLNDEVLPAGEQDIRIDGQPGRLSYHGGTVPAADIDAAAVARLVEQVRAAVPGLRGWWGIDFVIPHDPFPPGDPAANRDPVLIEVNPRLTTSYLGYRALARDNLAERLLFPERPFPPIRWKGGTARFTKDGRVTVTS